MNMIVGDYVQVISVEDADGIDTDDIQSFVGHIGVVIEAIQEPGYADEDQLILVRFAGTGPFKGFHFLPKGDQYPYPDGTHLIEADHVFTQMTFVAKGLRMIARPEQPITTHNFEEGGL